MDKFDFVGSMRNRQQEAFHVMKSMNVMAIKVKYRSSLRRFSACVNEKEPLDLDMVRLNGKIRSFFDFSPHDDLILTYTDEDGDVVTLVDDDDLRDVVRQKLKILRIDVQLNNEKGSGNSSDSTICSTPLSYSKTKNPLEIVSVPLDEALNSLPTALKERVTKLSCDLASKGITSSSTNFDEILVRLMRQSCHNQTPQSQSARNTDPNAFKDFAPGEELTKSNLMTKEIKGVGTESVAPCLREQASSEAEFIDLNLDPHDSNQTRCTAPTTCINSSNKDTNGHLNKESVGGGLFSSASGCSRLSVISTDRNSGVLGSITNQFPSSGVPMSHPSAVPLKMLPALYPFKGSYNQYDNSVSLFHKGIQCDGCGVHPIVGPRFKSKVRDFDLCRICFAQTRDVADYIRIDRPLANIEYNSVPPPQTIPMPAKSSLMKRARSKLDSCFVLDVNVLDGTVMAPSTIFKKIWRMRNNGDIDWPQGTQIVWIAGDKISKVNSVNLEIPADGVPRNGELDIAVDFVAPKLPGQYNSCWRMSSASCKTFGQRIWVDIRVDASLKVEVQNKGLRGIIDLNFPPDSSYSKGPRLVTSQVVGSCSSIPCYNSSIPEATTGIAAASDESLEADLLEESLVEQLELMGFNHGDSNKEALRRNEYNLEQTLNDLCDNAEWDSIEAKRW